MSAGYRCSYLERYYDKNENENEHPPSIQSRLKTLHTIDTVDIEAKALDINSSVTKLTQVSQSTLSTRRIMSFWIREFIDNNSTIAHNDNDSSMIAMIRQRYFPVEITDLVTIYVCDFLWRLHPSENALFPFLEVSNSGNSAENVAVEDSNGIIHFGDPIDINSHFFIEFEVRSATIEDVAAGFGVIKGATGDCAIAIVPSDYRAESESNPKLEDIADAYIVKLNGSISEWGLPKRQKTDEEVKEMFKACDKRRYRISVQMNTDESGDISGSLVISGWKQSYTIKNVKPKMQIVFELTPNTRVQLFDQEWLPAGCDGDVCSVM